MPVDNRSAHASSEYDSSIEKTIPYYSYIHEETLNVVRSINPSPGSWLDTGCGTGTLVMKAKERFAATAFYVCDPSPGMLGIAVNKLGGAASSLGAVDTLAIDGRWDNSFDVVTAIQCLHYLDLQGRSDAIRRCFDLLRAGGIFISFENTRPLTKEGTAIFLDYWKRFQIEAGKTSGQAESHIKRFGLEYFPITVAEHLALLRSTGFKVVELLWYSYMQSGYLCLKQ
jgi:tRNA (cmo5U34)-methyltransferase